MFKPSVLVLAVLLSSTALWSAFVDGSLDVTTALIRFLIAVPIAAVLLAGLRLIVGGYRTTAESATPVTPEPFDSTGPEKSP